MATEENEYWQQHLLELGDSDYEIVDGEPDITGWDVLDHENQKIGEVQELLFDPESRKVRYIIVELEEGELDVEDGKKVLIPIGVAALRSSDGFESDNDDAILANDPRLDETVIEVGDSGTHNLDRGVYNTSADDEQLDEVEEEDEDEEEFFDVVIVPVTVAQLRELPVYVKGQLSPVMEVSIRQVFEGSAAAGTTEYDRNGFYNHEYFDVDKFYDRGATTRSILPVSEPSLDEPLDESLNPTEPSAENPFDKDIEREKPGLGKIGY